jgi:hypothetical protein
MPDERSMTVVSVVSITYGDIDGLRRTIDSVSEQATSGQLQIEHVVVDGASDPAVVELAQESGARVISEPDRGRYDAMNKGMKAAAGDVLWFLHSGDTFGSERSVVDALRYVEQPRREWGYGMARRIRSDGKLEGFFGYAPFNLRRFSLGGKPLPHQACFFGADLLASMPAYSVEHGIAADQLFILEAAKRRSPIVVPEFLCDFDTGGAGSHRRAHEHFRDMRRASKTAGVTFSGHRFVDVCASWFFEGVETVARQRGS